MPKKTGDAENAPMPPIMRFIKQGDLPALKKALNDRPDLLHFEFAGMPSWLHEAAGSSSFEMVDYFLERGLDINKVDHPANTSPLTKAIWKGRVEMVRHLLAKGADPNIGRPLIDAINRDSEDVGLELVQALIEGGADVNRSYAMFGDEENRVTALGWATDAEKWGIVGYLKAHGAVDAAAQRPTPPTESTTLGDEVVAYFAEHVGPVHPKSLTEIVPSGDPPVAVHAIPPREDRNFLTLFTTGMSDHAMAVPEGQDEYRWAELFIQLPAKWPLSPARLADPNYGWPVDWLRKVARYPHENDTWLGGAVAIIANGDPPVRLAPKIPFTSMLLLAEKEFTSADGRPVQLYRLTPLYAEERDLELRKGVDALLRAFDRLGVPFVFDPKRTNVAKAGPGSK